MDDVANRGEGMGVEWIGLMGRKILPVTCIVIRDKCLCMYISVYSSDQTDLNGFYSYHGTPHFPN